MGCSGCRRKKNKIKGAKIKVPDEPAPGGCSADLNVEEAKLFIKLIDNKAPMKKIIRELGVPKRSIDCYIHYLSFYRKYVDLQEKIRIDVKKIKELPSREERQVARRKLQEEVREEQKEVGITNL